MNQEWILAAASTEDQILAVLAGVFVLVVAIGITSSRQSSIKKGAVRLPYVDPMPRFEILRTRFQVADRPLHSYLTPMRVLRILYMLPLAIGAPILFAQITHPAIGLLISGAVLFQLSVYAYQWLSVDLGLMRAEWGGWLHQTRPPKQDRDQ